MFSIGATEPSTYTPALPVFIDTEWLGKVQTSQDRGIYAQSIHGVDDDAIIL